MISKTPELPKPTRASNEEQQNSVSEKDDSTGSPKLTQSAKTNGEPKTDEATKSPESKISPTRPRRIQYKPKIKPKTKGGFQLIDENSQPSRCKGLALG